MPVMSHGSLQGYVYPGNYNTDGQLREQQCMFGSPPLYYTDRCNENYYSTERYNYESLSPQLQPKLEKVQRNIWQPLTRCNTDSNSSRLASERRREVRKVKSREAARCRRGKETEVFTDLIDALPVPDLSKATLDKASIIRLSINYMRLRDFFNNICDLNTPVFDDVSSYLKDIVEGMQTFVLVLSSSSEVIYVTENVKTLLGLSQYDVIGNKMTEFIHPCDISETLAITKSKENGNLDFISRFKTTLLPKGRVVNLKSAAYKPVKFTGRRLVADIKPQLSASSKESVQPLTECFILTGMPLVQPSHLDEPLDSMTFISSHSLDMKFVDCDTQMSNLVKYPAEMILGSSLYDMVHSLDIKQVEDSFKTLYAKGQTVTGTYRLLAYGGGYILAVTQATLVLNQKTSRPQQVICVHYLISQIEDEDVVMAQIQIPKTGSFVSVNEQAQSDVAGQHKADITDKCQDDIVSLTASMFGPEQLCDQKTDDRDIFNTTASMFVVDSDIQSATQSVLSSDSNFDDSDITSATTSVFSTSDSFDAPVAGPGKPDLEQLVDRLDSGIMDFNSGLVVDTTGLDDAFDEDFFMRAPYIPMDTENDVNLLEICYSPEKTDLDKYSGPSPVSKSFNGASTTFSDDTESQLRDSLSEVSTSPAGMDLNALAMRGMTVTQTREAEMDDSCIRNASSLIEESIISSQPENTVRPPSATYLSPAIMFCNLNEPDKATRLSNIQCSSSGRLNHSPDLNAACANQRVKRKLPPHLDSCGGQLQPLNMSESYPSYDSPDDSWSSDSSQDLCTGQKYFLESISNMEKLLSEVENPENLSLLEFLSLGERTDKVRRSDTGTGVVRYSDGYRALEAKRPKMMDVDSISAMNEELSYDANPGNRSAFSAYNVTARQLPGYRPIHSASPGMSRPKQRERNSDLQM